MTGLRSAGLIEIEAMRQQYPTFPIRPRPDEEESNIELATVELVMDARDRRIMWTAM
ncbi:MAG: hypothetical protein U5K27_02030 [Desulfotignum sp.]|nr:hypothetical protein [Desulfotignum sp.]